MEEKYSQVRDFSSKNIKRLKSRGWEVPRTDSRANYRKDMAQIDRVEHGKERDPFIGPTPKRYLKNFDRGAKKAANRKKRRSSSR